MTSSHPVDDTIRFAERLLVLLDRGGRSATYKFAVLIGLMDLCLEQSVADGSAPSMVTTYQLAEKVVALYWRQARPFETEQTLQQNSGSQAKIISLIVTFQGVHSPDPSSSLHRAQLHARAAFEALLRDVEWVLIKMPLPKLQRIGRSSTPFIYKIAWDDEVTRRQITAPDFDNRILFVDRAADHLVRLTGLMRPLIQRQWTGMVAQLNGHPEFHLGQFLFGQERISLQPAREPLLAIQAGRCFYCEKPISKDPQVDHFLPWSRHADNGLDNLVIADRTCNSAKSDHLAAVEHIARWSEHLGRHDHELTSIAETLSWERDRPRTINVVRAIYSRLPGDVQLWRSRTDFSGLQPAQLQATLESLPASAC